MPVYDTPIPCPCCLGKPGYKFDTVEVRYTTDPCTACKGTAILMVKRSQADRIQWEGVNRRGSFTEVERDIITAASTAVQAIKDLMEAGYTDRSYNAVKKWRTKHGIKRKRNKT